MVVGRSLLQINQFVRAFLPFLPRRHEDDHPPEINNKKWVGLASRSGGCRLQWAIIVGGLGRMRDLGDTARVPTYYETHT